MNVPPMLVAALAVSLLALVFAIVGYSMEVQANDDFDTKFPRARQPFRAELDAAGDTVAIDSVCLTEFTNSATGAGFETLVDTTHPRAPRIWGITAEEPIHVQDLIDHSVEISYDSSYPRAEPSFAPVHLSTVPVGSATLVEPAFWYGVVVNNKTYRLTISLQFTGLNTTGQHFRALLPLQDLALESSDELLINAEEAMLPTFATFRGAIVLGVLDLQMWTQAEIVGGNFNFSIETIFAKATS